MKYFTMKRWAENVGDPNEPFQLYEQYLSSILKDLPSEFCKLLHEVDLHDARLRQLNISITEATLTIHLDGCRYDPPSKSYFDRDIRLCYSGVQAITSTADPNLGLPGPHGYGDLGYHEIERLDSGTFQHRILFSTGIELHITFSGFQLSWQD
jgi:hypothetical protein